MPNAYAVDVSNWSGLISIQQAQGIKDAGYGRAIVSTYDPTVTRYQLESFRAVGLEAEAYVYMTFDGRTPESQIQQAHSVLNGTGIRRLWIDLEDGRASHYSVQDTVFFIANALAEAQRLGFEFGIYTRRDWWMRQTGNSTQFRGILLWDATNDHVPDLSFNPYGGWEQSYMEQHAFDQPVAGVNCDLNTYRAENVVVPTPGELSPDINKNTDITMIYQRVYGYSSGCQIENLPRLADGKRQYLVTLPA